MATLIELAPDGWLDATFHPGQMRAWESVKRFVLVLAGTQAGKTEFGPPWLWREIKSRGPGDYLVATPTFPLLELKCLPAFKRLFKKQMRLGEYVGSPTRKFTFSREGSRRLFGTADCDPTVIYFGHAQDPDSLESATVKAAWLDEAGQKKFRLGSWEAVLRRLAIHQGRVLISTTPYSLGWLKQQLHDPWVKAGENHPTIDLIRFRSIDNPAFPQEEYERARESLPAWRFRMFYDAIFTRPAGMIYDCFDDKVHKIPRFTVNPNWQRYVGIDFGGVNTAAVFAAEEPGSGRLFAYREYHAGGRTAKEHAKQFLKDEPRHPICIGGSHSEGQWRDEFRAAGLLVHEPPIKDVEVGIDRVYGAIKRNEFYVMEDLVGLLDELGSYSRELDERGEPTEKIEAKETYHRLDGVRYMIAWAKRGRASAPAAGAQASPVFGYQPR